jgi:hypothetical protein
MILSSLEFCREALHSVLASFFALPDEIRPTHHSLGENEIGEPILDYLAQIDALSRRKSGFFLKGHRVLYDISLAGDKHIICNCFLDVDPILAKRFLMEMASAQPVFGFACSQEERYERNRVTVKQGLNTIESWVGRDAQRYVPGFYWLTLLPESLAKQHGVSLAVVEKVAQEHLALDRGQHLFRFYKTPEDWLTTRAVAELCASIPGVFDVEKIKAGFSEAKNFLELDSMLRKWK